MSSLTAGVAQALGVGDCQYHMSWHWRFTGPAGPTVWGLAGTAQCIAKANISTTIGLLYALRPVATCPTGHNNETAFSTAISSCGRTLPEGVGTWTILLQTLVTQGGIGHCYQIDRCTLTKSVGVSGNVAVLSYNQVRVTMAMNTVVT
jgi:hypothetical protein